MSNDEPMPVMVTGEIRHTDGETSKFQLARWPDTRWSQWGNTRSVLGRSGVLVDAMAEAAVEHLVEDAGEYPPPNDLHFAVDIRCEHAAFNEDGQGPTYEVARILRELADRVEGSMDTLTHLDVAVPLMDYNGNKVGTGKFEYR